MRINHEPRQRTLSFKITQAIEDVLNRIRLKMSQKANRNVTKTDVIEAAIKELAKKEKVACQ